MQEPREHALELVVAVWQLPAGDGAADCVANQEHMHLDAVAFAQGARETERVIWPFAAVRLVVDDDEDLHRRIVAPPTPPANGTNFGSLCGYYRSPPRVTNSHGPATAATARCLDPEDGEASRRYRARTGSRRPSPRCFSWTQRRSLATDCSQRIEPDRALSAYP